MNAIVNGGVQWNRVEHLEQGGTVEQVEQVEQMFQRSTVPGGEAKAG